MKNYKPKHYTPSRKFYINELKKNNKNLKSNNISLDFLESNLDKLLKYSFKFFHPFFNDDEYESKRNYFSTSKNLDRDFDNKLEEYSPQWLLSLWSFILAIYKKIVNSKPINQLKNKTKQIIHNLKSIIVNRFNLKTIKFFAFKSPP